MNARWLAPAGLHTASARLPVEGELPSFSGATGWLNSPPQTPAGLRGKVALVDFLTYTCINWLRQLPYVRAWAGKYSGHGLVVIGVHTPEFPFEHDVDNIRPLRGQPGSLRPAPAVQSPYLDRIGTLPAAQRAALGTASALQPGRAPRAITTDFFNLTGKFTCCAPILRGTSYKVFPLVDAIKSPTESSHTRSNGIEGPLQRGSVSPLASEGASPTGRRADSPQLVRILSWTTGATRPRQIDERSSLTDVSSFRHRHRQGRPAAQHP